MTTDKYARWVIVPAHLRTKTQLRKDGLKPAPGQQPAAQKTGGRGPFDLYDVREAVPVRPLTEAQQAALAKARAAADEAAHCAGCGARFDRRGRWSHRYPTPEGDVCLECNDKQQARASARALLTKPFVVLDTETTGLDDKAQIVSIAVIDQAGETLLHTLVRPTVPIPAEATAIHGITDADVAGAPTMAELYDDLRALLSHRTVIIYNAEYDTRLLRQSIRAAHDRPVTPPSRWGIAPVCAMELYSSYLGTERWQKLTNAAASFGLDTSGAHGALADCRMTLGVVRGMAQ